METRIISVWNACIIFMSASEYGAFGGIARPPGIAAPVGIDGIDGMPVGSDIPIRDALPAATALDRDDVLGILVIPAMLACEAPAWPEVLLIRLIGSRPSFFAAI